MRRLGLVIDRRACADCPGQRVTQIAQVAKADLVDNRQTVEPGDHIAARIHFCQSQRRDHQSERIEPFGRIGGPVVDLTNTNDNGDARGISHRPGN